MLNKIFFVFFIIFSSQVISNSAIDRENEIINFVQKSQYHAGSVWLEQKSSYVDVWNKVLLVFGWYDDYAECLSIKSTYQEKYPSTPYRCNNVR